MLYTLDDIKVVDMGLSNRCNLRCVLCPYVHKKIYEQSPHYVNVSKLIDFLDKLKNIEVIIIEGNYCEPTLHPELPKLLEYIKTRPIDIRLSTNASTHNTEYWYKMGSLLKSNDIVRFAIDGSTQELHSKYRVNSKLDKVLENHRSLKSNPDFRGITVLQNIQFTYNQNDKENIYNLFKKEKFDYLSYLKCYPTSIQNQSEFNPPTKIKKYMDFYEKLLKTQKDISVICDSFNRHEIYVNHMGNINICGSLDEDEVHTGVNIESSDSDIEKFLNTRWCEPKCGVTCQSCCNYYCYTLGEKYPDILIDQNDVRLEMNYFTKELKNEEYNAGHRITRSKTNLI
ncbi:radical SAM protein [Campylobacter coli]|nr:radical SAM protein [Campylobacter coli]